MESDICSYMEEYLGTCFDIVRTIRETRRGSILRIRHKKSHKLYIWRSIPDEVPAYRALLGYRSDHLPVIHEAASGPGKTLVLEEYVPGDPLRTLLEGGTLEEPFVRDITLQLCDALHTLHTLGIVHRDVKPENVLLDGSRAVLIDFDASRILNPDGIQENDTQVLGTVGFAPPEQFGLAQTDPRTDIYAMGVLINIMLTLEHPSVRLASGTWGGIVNRCTMISPEKRYQTITELAAAVSGRGHFAGWKKKSHV